jgi:hypothetical protein
MTVRLKELLRNHPNHTNLGYSNRVRVYAARNCEHGYHYDVPPLSNDGWS